ncbi:hypothetical protein JTB14_023495 [Gonioctena quinquepunctata]|nr:hypothetical protein JTB14_023495 [Gonioctena quinquepunctata]
MCKQSDDSALRTLQYISHLGPVSSIKIFVDRTKTKTSRPHYILEDFVLVIFRLILIFKCKCSEEIFGVPWPTCSFGQCSVIVVDLRDAGSSASTGGLLPLTNGLGPYGRWPGSHQSGVLVAQSPEVQL